MHSLVWLRRELRLRDNPALFHACEQAEGDVTVIYLATPRLWARHDEAACKLGFHLDAVRDLAAECEKLNINFLVVESTGYKPSYTIKQLLKEHKITHCYFNRAIEPDEREDDQEMIEYCKSNHIRGCAYQQICILPPGSVVKDDGNPYSVFTPFKKKWYSVLAERPIELLGKPKKLTHANKVNIDLTALDNLDYQYEKKLWSATEKAAHQQLKKFIEEHLKAYKDKRDFPHQPGTSQLSPYLVAGIISARQCFHTAQQQHKSDGQLTWLSEIIWRDFYQHILYFYPRVGKHRAFKLETEKLTWNDDESLFKAWCEGQTGVPIVDAAMRQLNQTGWMHNRCRMIVAMFLTKNCFIDWRKGEQYFMQQLIDGELAANNGGWQWSASTGTDAAPYFRIFNPYRQSERFDPEGSYIREYVPELAHLSAKEIHEPPAQDNYPAPIVDVKASRKSAIEAFKGLT